MLDGTKILREIWGENVLIPLYDNEESVCGICFNGEYFYFQKNLQGDIISVADKDANEVAKYTYDAWGACTIVSDTSACNIATINTFRYRGYYYDIEIGMYYLQSRYYDPEVGRFINADIPQVFELFSPKEDIMRANLFAYCVNNATNYLDVVGYWAEKFKGFSWASKGFNVRMDNRFLSRQYCLLYAADIIRQKGSWQWWPMGWYYKKMDALRIAAELFGHAVVYYAAAVLDCIARTIGVSIGVLQTLMKEAGDLNVNNDDKKAWAYYLVWALAGAIKRYLPGKILRFFAL